MAIDFRKLYKATRKDHYHLPFIDQMLERLSKHTHFCFLDGYFGFSQIPVSQHDQEQITFTCPFGTYACRHMSFGLCNAPATFQTMHDCYILWFLWKDCWGFHGWFLRLRNFLWWLLNQPWSILQRCEETNLVLNWEKCHFMVNEGIVLGHKISEWGIEVDDTSPTYL